MKTPMFLKNKLKKQIDKNGIVYEFTKIMKDEFNQITDSEETLQVKGIYHETNSFIKLSESDAGSVQRKKSPMILTILDETTKLLTQGDKVVINEVSYTVSGLLDIQNYGVALDISLDMEV